MTVVNAYASFSLGSDGLVGEHVTAALGIEPSFARDKGAEISSPAGVRLQRTGVWLIESKGALQSAALDDHLRFLLARLEPRRDVVRTLIEERSLAARFFCYVAVTDGAGGLGVDADVLVRMGELGASLDLDLYLLPDTE